MRQRQRFTVSAEIIVIVEGSLTVNRGAAIALHEQVENMHTVHKVLCHVNFITKSVQ